MQCDKTLQSLSFGARFAKKQYAAILKLSWKIASGEVNDMMQYDILYDILAGASVCKKTVPRKHSHSGLAFVRSADLRVRPCYARLQPKFSECIGTAAFDPAPGLCQAGRQNDTARRLDVMHQLHEEKNVWRRGHQKKR